VKKSPDSFLQMTAKDTVTLRPSWRYRYGGWVKTEITQGRRLSFYVHEENADGSKGRIRSGKPFGPTRGEWREISRTHDAPAPPSAKLRMRFVVPAGAVGTIWLDDFFVEVIAPEPKPVRPKNLLFNSSFEEAGFPGWPDSWFIGAVKAGSLIGDPGATGQDRSTAWHGGHSLKINNPYPMRYGYARAWYRHEFLSSSVRGGIPVERGKTYTLSCYARAEKPGTFLSLALLNMARNSPVGGQGTAKRFKLTGEWQRVHVTITYPETGWQVGMRPELTFFLINQGVATGVWVDAVQLEEGAGPTGYVPREHSK